MTQRGLLRLADELDLADFVELINGDKEAPTRPVSHDMLVQETLLRYTGEIPEVRTAAVAPAAAGSPAGFAQASTTSTSTSTSISSFFWLCKVLKQALGRSRASWRGSDVF